MNYYSGNDVYERPVETQISMPSVMRLVYMWMFLGLLITAGVSYFIGTQPTLVAPLIRNPILLIGLMFAQLGIVIFISARIMKINPTTAIALFLLYSATVGVTLSFIFLVYTRQSIAFAFVTCAATFGVTSLFAFTTKMDLSRMGNLLFVGLIGLLIASIVNIFFASSLLFWLINYAGVALFIGLTAYDTQKIKNMAQAVQSGGTFGAPTTTVVRADGEVVTSTVDQNAMIQRVAIFGALNLYLDFINLFLFMLRIVGGGRR
jgi:FtsH-binding integral membrane protein